MSQRPYCSPYEERDIRLALAGIWDDDVRLSGADTGVYVEGDMPRAKRNPAHGNDWIVKCADVHKAWRWTDLTSEERSCAFLVLGLHDSTGQAAANVLGLSRHQVLRRVDKAVTKMTNWLNGKPLDDPQEAL